VTAEGNRIYGNGPETGIYLDGGGGEIIGNSISAEASDGIKLANGANPTITRNNLFDNDNYALNNLSATTTTVSAADNWWGDPSSPGGEGPGSGDEVSAGVTYSPWRTSPVALVTSAAEETLYAGRGMTVTNMLLFRNWAVPTDTLTVSLAETQSWLSSSHTFTVPLTETVGGSAVVTFTIPADAPLGATDWVTATAVSQADPTVTDTLSFQVLVVEMADLRVTKEVTATTTPVDVGQRITYTVVVTNAGPDPATGVTLTDTLPAELAFVSAQASQGSCSPSDGAEFSPSLEALLKRRLLWQRECIGQGRLSSLSACHSS